MGVRWGWGVDSCHEGDSVDTASVAKRAGRRCGGVGGDNGEALEGGPSSRGSWGGPGSGGEMQRESRADRGKEGEEVEKNACAQVRGTDSSARPVHCFGWRRAIAAGRGPIAAFFPIGGLPKSILPRHRRALALERRALEANRGKRRLHVVRRVRLGARRLASVRGRDHRSGRVVLLPKFTCFSVRGKKIELLNR